MTLLVSLPENFRRRATVNTKAVRSGEIDLLVGTHALIQDDVVFHRLGLVVITSSTVWS